MDHSLRSDRHSKPTTPKALRLKLVGKESVNFVADAFYAKKTYASEELRDVSTIVTNAH